MILNLMPTREQEMLAPGLYDATREWALSRERMRSEGPRLRPATPTPKAKPRRVIRVTW